MFIRSSVVCAGTDRRAGRPALLVTRAQVVPPLISYVRSGAVVVVNKGVNVELALGTSVGKYVVVQELFPSWVHRN